MNRLFLICATGLLAFMFPLAGIAQNYDRLWKEVEETRKKDLPQTLISQVNQIYEKARKEKNAPQMLKAYLSRVECQVGLTPDSRVGVSVRILSVGIRSSGSGQRIV